MYYYYYRIVSYSSIVRISLQPILLPSKNGGFTHSVISNAVLPGTCKYFGSYGGPNRLPGTSRGL